MSPASEAETAVLQYLDDGRTVTMEDVIQHFHRFTFNRIFSVVDRLSREGKIRLVREPSFEYRISLVDSNSSERLEARRHRSRSATEKPIGTLPSGDL